MRSYRGGGGRRGAGQQRLLWAVDNAAATPAMPGTRPARGSVDTARRRPQCAAQPELAQCRAAAGQI